MATAAERERWQSKRLFSTGEAAVICEVSQQTIIRCFDSGRLTGFRVPGSRFRRIPRESLILFMDANGIDTSVLGNARRRVAVIESDSTLASALTDRLGGPERSEVRVASTAFAAGLLVGSWNPQVIVVGLDVPGVEARAVIPLLREVVDKSVQIMALLEAESQIATKALRQAGADGVLPRTNDAAATADRIRALLRAS